MVLVEKVSAGGSYFAFESLHKLIPDLEGICCVVGVSLPIEEMNMPRIDWSRLDLETGQVSDHLRVVRGVREREGKEHSKKKGEYHFENLNFFL